VGRWLGLTPAYSAARFNVPAAQLTQGFGATTSQGGGPCQRRPPAPAYRQSDGSRQRLGDSPEARKVAFIALKNLQNPRICYVLM
jgi:hypothetical protein